MSRRAPYTGHHRMMVVGIDIGTTYSGVSYAILEPGHVPTIQSVDRWPGQGRAGGDQKIPSVLYYDQAGRVRAAGAEALLEINMYRAQDEQWVKSEWFKLHLLPKHLGLKDEDLPSLPRNKKIVEVFGDFLRYVYQCTRQYIEEVQIGGKELWKSLEGDAAFVLTHPNGWEGSQQAQMRSAAIHAGMIPDTLEGHSRIFFVTEGEASLHFCIGNERVSGIMDSGGGVIIVDAGGGTIDVSAYSFDVKVKAVREIAPAICHFQGSIFVTRRARSFLERKLYNSRYGSPDDILHITECFDESVKLKFKDPSQLSFIKFGSPRDSDASVDIKLGQLKLDGSTVADFFHPSINAIEQSVRDQQMAAYTTITSVLMVGGFSASDWLFSNIRDRFSTEGLRVYRPDGHLGKAAADGATSFLLDRLVSARVARRTLGTEIRRSFDPSDPEHQRRLAKVITDAPGNRTLSNAYDMMLAKGTLVQEKAVFRRSYTRQATTKLALNIVSQDILAYRGNDPNPQWIDVEPEMYEVYFTVIADASSAVAALQSLSRENGEQFYRFDYDIELLLGLTEPKAMIYWNEKGKGKRSPVTIVYNDEFGES